MKGSILIIIIIALSFSSCRQNRYVINTKHIDIDLTVTRMEKELFEVNPANLIDILEELKISDGEFLRILSFVINIGDTVDADWNSNMLRFVTDRQNVEVYRSVADAFGDISGLDPEMQLAWKHYRYYFPNNQIPRVYTCVSGFNNSIIVGENVIGVSLDRYLGADNKYYPMLGIYNYQRRSMIPEKIVPDCMYGWAASSWEIPVQSEGSNKLLDHILHEGRLLYFSRLMTPELPDSLIFGFTGMQMKFCENNEARMWEYLIEHDLLFSTDPMVIKKLIDDAPFTSYFTNESPGKAANWIGYRIVESYMSKNPKQTLSDLMNLRELNLVLESSKYSP